MKRLSVNKNVNIEEVLKASEPSALSLVIYSEVVNMLSNDITQKSLIQRIEQVVAVLMEERPFFKEELDYVETVNHLAQGFQENLPIEEFNTMSETQLKENCSFIMATKILSKIGEELTPEQMATFDEAIKRK